MYKRQFVKDPTPTWSFEFVPICEYTQALHWTTGILCPTPTPPYVSRGTL